MGVVPVDWETVTSVCDRASARAAELIRTAPRSDDSVPGMDWTVAEVAAHLVSLVPRYEPFVQDTPRPAFESMPALNAAELAPLRDRPLADLADDLERGTRALVALCPSGDAPARFFDRPSDCASLIALCAGELIVHGVDLARATGRPWSPTREEALVAIAGYAEILPVFADPDATRDRCIVFEVRLRGGPTLGLRFDDGELTVSSGPVARADCRMSADPVDFLLCSLGRRSQWRAVMTGKILAFGRKPWLGPRLRTLVVSA